MVKLSSSRGIRIDVPVLSVSWSFKDHSVNIQALRKGLIEHEASDTGGVPRLQSSCPDRLAEATKLNFASCVVHQTRSHNMFLWTINKPTIWLLILSFTKNRSRVFYVLSLWKICCIKNTTVWNLTTPANLALIPQQHVIHQASKYNRYHVYAITLCKLLEFLLVLDNMWYTKHRSRYNRTIGSST